MLSHEDHTHCKSGLTITCNICQVYNVILQIRNPRGGERLELSSTKSGEGQRLKPRLTFDIRHLQTLLLA